MKVFLISCLLFLETSIVFADKLPNISIDDESSVPAPSTPVAAVPAIPSPVVPAIPSPAVPEPLSVSQYSYKGNPISEDAFQAAYENFRDKLAIGSDKEFYDIAVAKRLACGNIQNTEKLKLPENTLNVLFPDKIYLLGSPSNNQSLRYARLMSSLNNKIAISGVPANLEMGTIKCNFMLVEKGTYTTKVNMFHHGEGLNTEERSYKLYKYAKSPLNKEEFKAYLDSGATLYNYKDVYQKSEDLPTCPICKGRGKTIPKGRLSEITCPSCKGSGKQGTTALLSIDALPVDLK